MSDSQQLSIDALELANAVVLTLTGVVDARTAPSLHAAVDEFLASAPRSKIILELAGVEFVDSSGLGAFVSLHRRVESHGAALILAAPRATVRNSIRLTCLDRVLQVRATLIEVVAA